MLSLIALVAVSFFSASEVDIESGAFSYDLIKLEPSNSSVFESKSSSNWYQIDQKGLRLKFASKIESLYIKKIDITKALVGLQNSLLKNGQAGVIFVGGGAAGLIISLLSPVVFQLIKDPELFAAIVSYYSENLDKSSISN